MKRKRIYTTRKPARAGGRVKVVVSEDSPASKECLILAEKLEAAQQEVVVHALYFAQLREALGRSEENLRVVEGTALKQLFSLLATRAPRLQNLEDSLVYFLNAYRASGNDIPKDGDVVAFCPPVSGG